MVTQLNIVSDEKSKHLITPGNFESINDVEESKTEFSKNGLALKVSSVLQATLDIETLIKLFSQQIRPAIPHDGFTYHNDPLGLALSLGKKSKHNCQYRLLVNGEALGELSLHRSWQFSPEDKKIFEYTLSGVVYPLRNAILYSQALNAVHKDPLTGVYNRATLEENLNREVKLAQRYDRKLSLIILDIDNFKSVNDQYGHSIGDEVIRSTATLTSGCIRSTDILFRYGGEEFVILLSNTDIDGAVYLAERIRRSVANANVRFDDKLIKSSISLGVAELKAEELNAAFFSRADKALYDAKNSGKNRVCVAKD